MNKLINNFILQFFDNLHRLKRNILIIKEAVTKFYLNEEETIEDSLIDFNLDRLDNEDSVSILDKAKENSNDTKVNATVEYMGANVPMIYAFVTKYALNCIKVGYTELGVSKRIKQWQENYEDAEEIGRWPAEVIINTTEGDIEKRLYFKDFTVHNTLRNEYGYKQSGKDAVLRNEIANTIRQLKYNNDTTIDVHVSSEFFRMLQGGIENESQKVKEEVLDKVIETICENIRNGNELNYALYTYDKDGNGVKDLVHDWNSAPKDYKMTGIQVECVTNAKEAIKNGKTELLMSASPRYGKTHVSYQIIKDNITDRKSQYVLVTSAKADVRTAWRDDINHKDFINDFVFIEYMGGNIYVTSKISGVHLTTTNLGVYEDACITLGDDIVSYYLKQNKIVIVFATLQYLSGKASEIEDTTINESRKTNFKDNIIQFLKKVNPWMMVIDETHYGSHSNKLGATTGLNKNVDIEGEEYLDEYMQHKEEYDKILNKTIKTSIRMLCSGTPYYILADGEFDIESRPNAAIISDVTFSDMVAARDQWIKDNPDVQEQESPYFGIPNIKKFGMKLTESCYKSLAEDEVSIKLNNLFLIDRKTKRFIHEDAIVDLMTSIFGEKDNNAIGFLNQKDIVEGRIFKHTMIVLPGINACALLEKLLKEKILNSDNREVITLVERRTALTDDGIKLDPRAETPDTLNKTLNALDIKGKKSVTLTCVRFLTGVSIPLLDSMLYMKDSKSPQDYDQAILRLCTRHVVENKETGIKVNLKPNVYLIDFNICRMFDLMKRSAEDMIYAKSLNNKHISMDEMIQKELTAEPIYIEDNVYDNGNADEVLAGMHEVHMDEFMKLYVKYNSQKSIGDLIDENLKAKRFNNFCLKHRDLLAGINASKISGKTLKDEYGNDTTEAPENSEYDGNYDGEDTLNNIEKIKDSKRDKDLLKLLKDAAEQLKTIITNMLYSNICFDSPAKDCKDFINKIQDKENLNILKSFNAELGVEKIKNIYESFTKEEKIIIDGLLKNIELLLSDEKLSPIQRTITALKKLGKISELEVVTPPEIVEKLIDSIDPKPGDYILATNEKYAEIIIGLYDKLVKQHGDEYAKKALSNVTILPSSSTTINFINKVNKILGINANIHVPENFKQKETYNILEYYKDIDMKSFKNNITQSKGFDFIVQNPPYNGSMHLDFFQKGLDVLAKDGKMNIIEPSQLYISLKKNGKYKKEGSAFKKLYDLLKKEKHIKKVIIENFNKVFGIANKTALSITYYDRTKEYNDIAFENCGEKINAKSLDDINYIGNGDIVNSILNKCLSYKDHMIDHCIKLKNYRDYENKGYYFISYGNYMLNCIGSNYGGVVNQYKNRTICRGHSNGNFLNSYTVVGSGLKISYNEVAKGIKHNTPFDSVFGTKNEMENWQYFNFNNKLPLFINICLTIDENNNSREYIPWLVDKKYTDQEIYDILDITKEEQDLIDYTLRKFEYDSVWFKRYMTGDTAITDKEINEYLNKK